LLDSLLQENNVSSFQLPELVDGDNLAYMHLCIHQVVLALNLGQEQEWLLGHLLEVGKDRGEAEPLGSCQLCGDGLAYSFHI